MLVAADLMRSDKVVLKWLTDTKDIMALIGGIMSVVQPELFSIVPAVQTAIAAYPSTFPRSLIT